MQLTDDRNPLQTEFSFRSYSSNTSLKSHSTPQSDGGEQDNQVTHLELSRQQVVAVNIEMAFLTHVNSLGEGRKEEKVKHPTWFFCLITCNSQKLGLHLTLQILIRILCLPSMRTSFCIFHYGYILSFKSHRFYHLPERCLWSSMFSRNRMDNKVYI